jgi:hypothetical protein
VNEKTESLKRIKIGDTVKVHDGSYSVLVNKKTAETKHAYGIYLETRRLQVIGKKILKKFGFPYLEGRGKECENDLIVVDLDTGDIIFTQARFCYRVKYVEKVCPHCLQKHYETEVLY